MHTYIYILSIVITAALGSYHQGGTTYPWSPKLLVKIEKAVATTYAAEGLSIEAVKIDASLEQHLQRPINERLYKVSNGNHQLGYIYVDQSPSMKDVFDFIVLLDNELTIVNSKVLIYRESHGRQIGTRRWLKQFDGKQAGDRVSLNTNIDGITGATISTTSMTNAVNDVLVTLDDLRHQELL